MVHVWRVSDGIERTTYVLKDNVGKLVFSPDSRYLAIASDIFAVYDLTSESNSRVIYYTGIAPHPTSEILFSPDGHSLITEGELNDANHNLWIPRILVWNLSSNRDAVRKVPLTDAIQNMVVLPDGQTVLGYDASKGQLDAIDTPSKSIVGTVDLGTLLFMDYSADLSRFVVVTQTSVAIWGVSP
jgi:WD40 repeat protein